MTRPMSDVERRPRKKPRQTPSDRQAVYAAVQDDLRLGHKPDLHDYGRRFRRLSCSTLCDYMQDAARRFRNGMDGADDSGGVNDAELADRIKQAREDRHQAEKQFREKHFDVWIARTPNPIPQVGRPRFGKKDASSGR